MKKYILVLLTVTASLVCLGLGSAAGQAVYHYGPEKVELTGVLMQKTFYGPPGYGEDPRHDRKEHVYILRLEKPIRVIAAARDSRNEGHDNVRELQVDDNGKMPLKSLLKKKVRVRGSLRSAEIGHDHTDVLITPEHIGQDNGRAPETAGSPEDIVRRYCSLDASGARLSSAAFKDISPLITWSEEPGWDASTVITGFKISDAAIRGDEARVTVQYHKLGEDSGGFRKEKGIEEVVFVLVRKEKGWQIREPLIHPHVDKAAMIQYYRGLQKDSPARRQELEGIIKKIEASSK